MDTYLEWNGVCACGKVEMDVIRMDYSNKVCKNGHIGMYDNHRKCKECNKINNLARYHANADEYNRLAKDRRKSNIENARSRDRAYYAANAEKIRTRERIRRFDNPERDMLNQARSRARRDGYPCTITEADIIIPKLCPLLGIELKRNMNKVGFNSPTLDKIIPTLGYVPNNVIVISHRANAIKNNATIEELQKLINNLLALCHGD